MLPLEMFITVFAAFAVMPTVLGAPSGIYYSVELLTCGTSQNTTASECGHICAPVMKAQSSCHGVPSCTCTVAPADAIQACLQCHIDEDFHRYIGDLRLEVPPRVETYALMCDNILSTRSLDTLPKLNISESLATRSIVPREQSICIYGLPDVILLPQAFSSAVLSSYRSPWFLFGFAVVALICILPFRRKSSP